MPGVKRENWEMSGIFGPNRLKENTGDQSFLILGWQRRDSDGEVILHLSFRGLDEIGERVSQSE